MNKLINVSCGIMYNNKNKFLMGLRKKNTEDGDYWEFPGGKIENNENLIQCLHREFKEELNLEIEVIKECYSYIYKNKYLCSFYIGIIKNIDDLKMNVHQEIKFVNIEEARKLKLFPNDFEILNRL